MCVNIAAPHVFTIVQQYLVIEWSKMSIYLLVDSEQMQDHARAWLFNLNSMYKPAGLTESACGTAMVVMTKGGFHATTTPPDLPLHAWLFNLNSMRDIYSWLKK